MNDLSFISGNISATRRFLLLFFCVFLIYIQSEICANHSQSSAIQHTIRADSLAKLEFYREAIIEIKKAISLTDGAKYPRQMGINLNKLGSYLVMSGKEQQAFYELHRARILAVAEKDSITSSNIYNNLGRAHEYTGNLDSAFFYYSKSLELREQFNDTTKLSESYRNVAQVLRVLMRLDEAAGYCKKAFLLIPGIKDYKITANIYNETAYLYELRHQPDSAALYYNKLIEISKVNGFTRGLSVGYSNLASVYKQKGWFHRALELVKQGLNLDKKIGNIYGMMTSYRNIAETYLLLRQYKNALAFLDSSALICDSAWIADLQGIEESKYQVYRAMGNYKLALLHFETSTLLKDSVLNERKRKNIAEILTRYETDKKARKIEILNQTNELNEKKIRIHLLLLVLVVLFSMSGAVISMLIIRNKNLRLKQMHLELKNYMCLLDEEAKVSNNLPMHETPVQTLIERFELTQREAEIMQLIGQGLTNSELGENLFISANTIKYHIKNIYIKLDVSNRVQALKKTSIN